MIGIVAMVAELLSVRGSDNLSVPYISALFIFIFLNDMSSDQKLQIITGLIASAIVSYFSFRFKFLDISGALAAFLLGAIIFGLGGIQYTVPIVLFFISSSFLSKIGKERKKKIENSYQKSGIRDLYQVFANGGIPAIILISIYLFSSDHLFPVYLSALAAATADTWSTELGIYSKKNPKLITTFETVTPGTSGAVSLKGLLFSLFGSAFIAASGFLYFNTDPLILFFLVTISGFSGSLIDSFIGATLQGQYTCSACLLNTEKLIHCQIPTTHIRGYKWLNNDFVNIFSIIFSVFLLIIYINWI